MNGARTFSVFKRLFLIYSLLIVLVYAVLVVFFLNSIGRSSQELVESKRAQSQTFLKNLEQQLDTVYRHEVNLANSSDVTRLAYGIYQDQYERSRLVLELIRTIEGIQSMSPLIEEILITYPGSSITLSSLNGYRKLAEGAGGPVQRGREYDYLVSRGNRIVMNFSYPLKYSVSEDYIADFNIQFLLSADQIIGSLDSIGGERGSGTAVLFRLDRNLILESQGGTIVSRYVSDVRRKEVLKDYQFISAESQKYPVSVIAYVNRQIIRRIIVKYLLLSTAVLIFLAGLYAVSLFYTKRIAVKPLRELMWAFGKIREGDFGVRIFHEPHDEFNYLYNGFNDTVSHIQELIADIYEQKHLIQNAELAQLQSQINPHFLYNSFFIINRMVKNEDYELVTKFVTSLARYYRFINKESGSFIPLAREVEHMQNYIDIQQIRFGEKITVDMQALPEEIAEVPVPKLILQPLIENAYNYGLADKLSGGLILISFTVKGSLVEISVEDNGDAADPALADSMTRQLEENLDQGNHALHNIHHRLILAYGERCGVAVKLGVLGGIRVTLRIDRSIRPS